MVKIRLFVLLLCWLISPVQAQVFDGAKGHIFDQTYVTRVQAVLANAIAEQDNLIEQWRFSTWSHRNKEELPPEVKRQGKRLIINGNNIFPLILQSDVYREKNDGGDGQIFTYLKTLKNYHLLGVEFNDGEPHFILVNRRSLKIYFVDFESDEP